MRLSSDSPKTALGGHPKGLTGNPARDLANSFNVRVILFLALHAPLALAMNVSPWFATAHGVLALLFGLRAALLGRTSQVIYAVAYIAAAEVLWRMSRSNLLWEYAKYAIVVVIFVALVAEWGRRTEVLRLRSVWPALLLVALIPASVITVLQVGVTVSGAGRAGLLSVGAADRPRHDHAPPVGDHGPHRGHHLSGGLLYADRPE